MARVEDLSFENQPLDAIQRTDVQEAVGEWAESFPRSLS